MQLIVEANSILSDLKVNQVDATDLSGLEPFCRRARDLGYHNNSSLSALKVNQIAEGRLAYWTLHQADQVVGISGCQALPELSSDCYRILFRACMLPEIKFSQGLSRSAISSSPLWQLIVPLQIQWAQRFGGKRLVVSVNRSDDDAELPMKMSKVGRVMKSMKRMGYVRLWKENELLYGANQDIYELNLNCYNSELRRINQSLNSIY